MEQEIKLYITDHPLAREQKYRTQAIWNFLKRKYRFESMSQDFFYKHGTEIDSVRRLITKIQEFHPELRGKDWSERKAREQEKQLALGVAEMGYNVKIHA